MGGGILPISQKNGRYYVLLSRESIDVKWKDSGKWSDFGGSREGNESEYDTALREGTEESCGIIGSKKNIEYLVKNKCLNIIHINHYSTYLVEIPYNSMLPYKFNKTYRLALKNTPDVVLSNNGLFEKDKVRWVPVDELLQFRNYTRFWFKPIVTKVYNIYKSN